MPEFVNTIAMIVAVSGAVLMVIAFVIYPNVVLATVLHETGHVLAAGLVGIPIRYVRLGRGKVWLHSRLSGIRVLLAGRMPPGLTQGYSVVHIGRTGRVVFALGGCAVNLLTAFALYALSESVESELAFYALQACFFVHFVIGVFNLWPRPTVNAEGKPGVSDGELVRAALRLDLTEVEAQRALWLATFARFGPPPPKLDAAAVRVMSLYISNPGPDPQARRLHWEDMERERSHTHIPSVRLLLIDGGVTMMLYDDRDADLIRLADWAQELRRLAPPELATARGSLGAVSVLLGYPAEGKPDLIAAAQGTTFDRLMSMAYLARAEMALGDRAAAEQSLAEGFKVVEADPSLKTSPAWSLVQRFAAEIGYAPAPLPAIAPA